MQPGFLLQTQRIAEKKAALDLLRPLSPQSIAELNRWYDVELTYTSDALEGNTLTRSETAIVLEKGITVSGKPLKDHLEAIGHRDALAYVRSLAAGTEPLRESDLRSIHRLVMQRVDPGEAGSYSRHGRMITGSPLALPSPAEIPARMGDFASWLQHVPATPETAFDAHESLVTIHPFSDGNGRTARLLMNLILLRAGYPPIVIQPEHRAAYHDSLQAVQLRQDRPAWHSFLHTHLEAALDHYLRLLSVPEISGPKNVSI